MNTQINYLQSQTQSIIQFTTSDLQQEEKLNYSNNNLSSLINTNTKTTKAFFYELKFESENNNTITNLEYITFKNYYTASISIMIKYENSWKSILNDFKIMENADCEEEAEKYVLIHKSKFSTPLDNLNYSKIDRMKIYISQPNTHIFNKFKISNIKLFSSVIYSEIQNNKKITETSEYNNVLSKNLNKNTNSGDNTSKNNFCSVVGLNKLYLGNGLFFIDKNVVLNTDKNDVMASLLHYNKAHQKPQFKVLI